MLIVFEGCDLVGKSTIANLLASDPDFTKFDFFKIRQRYPDDWMDYIDFCAEVEYNALRQFLDSERDIVVERFHVSSIIYNQVYDRGYDLGYIRNEDLDKILTVYVTVPYYVLKQRIGKREEDQKILDRLVQLHEAYEDFFKTYEFPCIKLDGTDDPEVNVKYIVQAIMAADGK